ncbi:unnamed protein product [Phytophthora fragariaefolia]|uniref:Unnamed protein product n=1 Tax=Phytophthora fragariaefolia TaxID=1490495 RepID=A0A9W6Y6Q6_9STRA|nr:unnamed protein product [Phytophthora fragariaefolia]
MCNYILDSGFKCKAKPSQERCGMHPFSKFPPIENFSPEVSEDMMKKIISAPMDERITCLCGSSMERWNFAKHCNKDKHSKWIKSMPYPQDLGWWGPDYSKW